MRLIVTTSLILCVCDGMTPGSDNGGNGGASGGGSGAMVTQ
jgi:hypothetical protein